MRLGYIFLIWFLSLILFISNLIGFGEMIIITVTFMFAMQEEMWKEEVREVKRKGNSK